VKRLSGHARSSCYVETCLPDRYAGRRVPEAHVCESCQGTLLPVLVVQLYWKLYCNRWRACFTACIVGNDALSAAAKRVIVCKRLSLCI
jgi:hypothetical protein